MSGPEERHDPTQRCSPLWRWGSAAGVAGVAGLAFLVRCLGFEEVFVGDGEVILRLGDGYGHARRAAVTFLQFPALLVFDAYINHPAGAASPAPPLYPWGIGALARIFFSQDPYAVERAAAWAAPVLGALAVWPVAWTARHFGGVGTMMGAGALYALFPVIALSSRLGDADHHAAVSLLGAGMLALAVGLADPERRPGFGAGLLLVALRLAMALTWSGSLAYLVVLDATIVGAAALNARRDVLRLEAASAAVTALILAPIVLRLPVPAWGAWSTGSLSLFHVALLPGVALVSSLLWLVEGRRPSRAFPGRALRLVICGGLVAAALLLVPGVRNGLLFGVDFVSLGNRDGAFIAELLPLFPWFGKPVLGPPERALGWLAYAVPLAPLVVLLGWRDPRTRAPAAVLAAWTAVFAVLFINQYRFGTEFAASGAVAFAWAIAAGLRRVMPLLRLPGPALPALGICVGALLLWPALAHTYWPLARLGFEVERARSTPEYRALRTPAGSLAHFLKEVRAHTPETGGWFGAGQPEYGILCRANLGHGLQFLARRASPSSGYMYMAGVENFVSSESFFTQSQELDAVLIANELRSRYVLTAHYPGIERGGIEAHLQRHDGVAKGRKQRLFHFRLVTEGPAGGAPLGDLFGFPRPARVVPYKLFEIVRGAVIEVPARPGSSVVATVQITTPTGRRFDYQAQSKAGRQGVARLAVPYATDVTLPARPVAAWTVEVEGESYAVEVPEADVQEGRHVRVPHTPKPEPVARRGPAKRREGRPPAG